MADFSPAQHQAREQRKIELAQAELQAQLNGSEKAPSFEPPYCPTEARERHQQRLADRGTPFVMHAADIAVATSDTWQESIRLAEGTWKLPAGAFAKGGGPS